jgi:hypothetical protein
MGVTGGCHIPGENLDLKMEWRAPWQGYQRTGTGKLSIT